MENAVFAVRFSIRSCESQFYVLRGCSLCIEEEESSLEYERWQHNHFVLLMYAYMCIIIIYLAYGLLELKRMVVSLFPQRQARHATSY